jgi:hypothetical protein
MFDFRIIQAQATLFTPAVSYRGSRFLSHFMFKWGDLFDGEPTSFEPPTDFPPEIRGTFPRAILKSEDSMVGLQVTTQRLDFFCKAIDGASVDLREHFKRATEMFIDYKEHMPADVNRVASLVTRKTLDENPARTISRHFCRDEWLAGPINRPEEFEVHALKNYRLADTFDVNSWFRCKSATLVVKEAPEKLNQRVILVEQDLNTREEGYLLNQDEIRRYFSLAQDELGSIFKLYFPPNAD